MRRAVRLVGVFFAVVSGYWVVRRLGRRDPPRSQIAVEIRVTPKSQPHVDIESEAPPAPPMRPARTSVWKEREPRDLDLRAPAFAAAAIAVAALAFWFAELHPRADPAVVQQRVAVTHPGSTIGCLQRTRNASQFSCAVTYAAASECVAVSVSMLGHLSNGRLARGACDAPQLEALLPHPVTPTGVATDLTRLTGGRRFACARLTAGGSRFACARAGAHGLECRLVLVAPWTPLRPHEGGRTCRSVAALRQTVIG